jgi:hypothetical protein
LPVDAVRISNRYDALKIEKISSEKRRRLGLPLGKRSASPIFPNMENPNGR